MVLGGSADVCSHSALGASIMLLATRACLYLPISAHHARVDDSRHTQWLSAATNEPGSTSSRAAAAAAAAAGASAAAGDSAAAGVSAEGVAFGAALAASSGASGSWSGTTRDRTSRETGAIGRAVAGFVPG